MPHQPVNVLLTKLTWLHFGLKWKVKGELTRRARTGSIMVNKKFGCPKRALYISQPGKLDRC
jgi:hypothetical protein